MLFDQRRLIPSYRASKLMERLTGPAWLATKMLDISQLKSKVQFLLDHLWKERQPLDFLRVFTTL